MLSSARRLIVRLLFGCCFLCRVCRTFFPVPGDHGQKEADGRTKVAHAVVGDKQAVGQLAADVRKIRRPEPYKGKGIRYSNERVKIKAGKTGKKK